MVENLNSIMKLLYRTNNVLYILLLLCAWTLLAVQLQLSFLQIKVEWPLELCNNLNNIYVNLSYSFIAGYVFYLLTIHLPKRTESKRLQPVIQQKIVGIGKELRNILLEFSRKTNIQDYLKEDNVRIILMSKRWTDYMPMYQYLYKANISYIAFIGEVGKIIQKNIIDLIQTYQEYLTIEQICLLEELAHMQIFNLANQFKQMNISLEDENGKKHLVDSFIEVLHKMSEIESSFSINS